MPPVHLESEQQRAQAEEVKEAYRATMEEREQQIAEEPPMAPQPAEAPTSSPEPPPQPEPEEEQE